MKYMHLRIKEEDKTFLESILKSGETLSSFMRDCAMEEAKKRSAKDDSTRA